MIVTVKPFHSLRPGETAVARVSNNSFLLSLTAQQGYNFSHKAKNSGAKLNDTIDLFSGSEGLPVPRRPQQQLLSFGKHKGQPFEVLLQDSGYALWLMSSMFAKLQTNHPELLAFLVSRYGMPDRTPVHNKLQNKFLDDSFCVQFALAGSAKVRTAVEHLSKTVINVEALWRDRVEVSTRRLSSLSGMDERKSEIGAAEKALNKVQVALLHEAEHIWVAGVSGSSTKGEMCDVARIRALELEVDGADVRFLVEQSYVVGTQLHVSTRSYNAPDTIYLGSYGESETFRIEVKPILGDDYPAVLRTMKATNCTHLLVAEYCGEGATWQEVVKVFALSKIVAVLLDDVEKTAISDFFNGIFVKHMDLEKAKDIALAALEKQRIFLQKA